MGVEDRRNILDVVAVLSGENGGRKYGGGVGVGGVKIPPTQKRVKQIFSSYES